MFTKEQINNLLSRQAKTYFDTYPNTYEDFAEQAKQIIINIVAIDLTDIPDWVKQPFVWILDYLLQSQFTGQSQEILDLTEKHYKEALKILSDKKSNSDKASNAKVFYFNNDYRLENI
ncbi:MAG: hypothetical protein NZM09_12070 [Ignavibacterium sp.]|nr:hypothetical protein [Ignavibacterium sp.]MDW8376411.1 hypothetical protein [Ignavibacteriales bacterium]